jgi:AcrR family transcriptional regulator
VTEEKMPPRMRRTQAERSASTREALLDASIRMLHAHGYGATSLLLITEAAGVSRGAMLHQFPTKADLMAFVVETVYADELQQYPRLLAGTKSQEEMLLAFPEALWKVLSRPSGVAVLEILQGSRSDPALAEKVLPIYDRIEQDSLGNVSRSTAADPALLVPMVRLVVWAIRGLSVAKTIHSDVEPTPTAVTLLRDLLKAGLETGLLAVGADKGGAA